MYLPREAAPLNFSELILRQRCNIFVLEMGGCQNRGTPPLKRADRQDIAILRSSQLAVLVDVAHRPWVCMY